MIEFKPMASAHDGSSYHQAKTPIDFWCRRDYHQDNVSLKLLFFMQMTKNDLTIILRLSCPLKKKNAINILNAINVIES